MYDYWQDQPDWIDSKMKKILQKLTVNHDIQKMNLYLNRCGHAGNFFTIYTP